MTFLEPVPYLVSKSLVELSDHLTSIIGDNVATGKKTDVFGDVTEEVDERRSSGGISGKKKNLRTVVLNVLISTF